MLNFQNLLERYNNCYIITLQRYKLKLNKQIKFILFLKFL